MVDVVFSVARIFAALVLVLLNGFFVASEFALVRVRSTAVDQMVAEGRAGAASLKDIMDNLDDYLAVTQLGITLASLALGWIGEPAVAALLEPVLTDVLPASLLHLVAFTIAFSFITFLHVVFGELAPKTIAIAEAEKLSLFVAPPMKLCYYLFVPGIVVFNGTANAFTRLIGIPPASETEETLTEEEILMVLSRSGQKGHVDVEEVEMIERVFELDDLSLREVMIPGPDVVTVETDTTLAELRALIGDAGHTRYPVLAEDGSEVAGFLDVKDVLARLDEDPEGDTLTAGELARPLPLLPETGRVDEALAEFQRESTQMAAVIDEWGAFEGIVTVEDVVEVVVGDLRDNFDVADREPTIEQQADGGYVADGSVTLTALSETLEDTIERDQVGTVGGLVQDRLGRAAEVGDTVETEGYTFEVTTVDGARVATVEVREATGSEGAADADST